MFSLACLQTNNFLSIQWLSREWVRLSEAQTSCQGSSGSLGGNFMLRNDILWLNLNGFPGEVIYFFKRKALLSRLQPGTSFVVVLSAHPGVHCAVPASCSEDGSVSSVCCWGSDELVGCLQGRWGFTSTKWHSAVNPFPVWSCACIWQFSCPLLLTLVLRPPILLSGNYSFCIG